MESQCLNELSVLGLWQDAIRAGNKQIDRSWNREGCGKHSASTLFHGHAVCIKSQRARGPWESPASCCGLLRHNSHRLLKGFCLKQNHGGEIWAHHKMTLRYVQMNQCASHYAGLVLQKKKKKRQASLPETKAQLFAIIDLSELAWALPFPSFTFRFSSQNNNTFCQ